MLCIDHYRWAAGAQWEVLNRLFWSKSSAAGRCWCGRTLLPYKLTETIHSHKKASIIYWRYSADRVRGDGRGFTYCSASHLPGQSAQRQMFSHGWRLNERKLCHT